MWDRLDYRTHPQGTRRRRAAASHARPETTLLGCSTTRDLAKGFSGASTRIVAPFDLTTPLGPFFRVAEVARRRDSFAPGHFRAANPRVEGRIGPLNLRSTAHALRLWSRANRSLIGRLSDISIKGTKNEQIIRPRSPHHPLEPRGKKPIQPREPRLVMRPGIRQRAQRAV